MFHECRNEVGVAMVSISICFLTKWSIVRMSHTMCFELFHECAQRSVLRVIENIPKLHRLSIFRHHAGLVFGMCMVNAEIKRC